VSAKIAPSWMTMVYIFQYASSSGIFMRASVIRKCAVELTGRNSVKPSTMPVGQTANKDSKKPPWCGERAACE